jgi:hypothetical protein
VASPLPSYLPSDCSLPRSSPVTPSRGNTRSGRPCRPPKFLEDYDLST